jgi:hypothetical protein
MCITLLGDAEEHLVLFKGFLKDQKKADSTAKSSLLASFNGYASDVRKASLLSALARRTKKRRSARLPADLKKSLSPKSLRLWLFRRDFCFLDLHLHILLAKFVCVVRALQ